MKPKFVKGQAVLCSGEVGYIDDVVKYEDTTKRVAGFSYNVDFNALGTKRISEPELEPVIQINGIRMAPGVKCSLNGKNVKITTVDPFNKKVEVTYEEDGVMDVVDFGALDLYIHNADISNVGTIGKYELEGKNLGRLVDEKQAAYGDSIAQTEKLMQVFLSRYEEGNTYKIPKSLLNHILLQVRIIDKQNRIFSNPAGDLMAESPYKDIAGYGLLGNRKSEQTT